MKWEEYLTELLSTYKGLDSIEISFDNGHVYREIPLIVKASIAMLDRMNEKLGPFNVFVFPEREQSFLTFVLIEVLHSISTGKISSTYDPTGFSIGEKLKIGNAIVEYLGLEERDNSLCLMVKCSDLNKSSVPIEALPNFQKVTTNRKLSKYKQYAEARKKALESVSDFLRDDSIIKHTAEIKTHLDKSVYVVSSIAGPKEQLNNCRIADKKVQELLYIAQANYEGKLTNVSPGQMYGIPAIVLTSDFYSLNSALNENPALLVVVDVSNGNMLSSQIDALDELLSRKIPVVCITDMANSFELEPLVSRKFHVWRWNNDTLIHQLYDNPITASDRKVKNCSEHDIEYIKAEGDEICHAMKLLSSHRNETPEQSGNMIKLFEKLNNLTFNAMRTTIPFSNMINELANRTLDECESLLNKETIFLDESSSSDYHDVINNLRNIYTDGFPFAKISQLKSFLHENSGKQFVLVVPERAPKTEIQEYWYRWNLQHAGDAKLIVTLPSEYHTLTQEGLSGTIVCGWLKRAIMRKILYGFVTSKYYVLLYDYESRWQSHDSHKWARVLNSSENKRIIETSFSTKDRPIATDDFVVSQLQSVDSEDELGEIELILHENRLKQYVHSGTTKDDVRAIPVSFVGGYLSFYRTGHKVISATDIITGRSNKISLKIPEELKQGDFIVIREADRDIIRELADTALRNSGEEKLRETASKWREALNIELLFCSEDELYKRMKAAGCTKESSTLRHWISDEDLIAPQSREDIEIIAEVTDNETLREMVDVVYNAAQKVKSAHVLAGRKLSEQLRLTLGEELKKYGEIDPFNFWEPISIEVDGIGIVKVLKIIDISPEVSINVGDTNRLIEE